MGDPHSRYSTLKNLNFHCLIMSTRKNQVILKSNVLDMGKPISPIRPVKDSSSTPEEVGNISDSMLSKSSVKLPCQFLLGFSVIISINLLRD